RFINTPATFLGSPYCLHRGAKLNRVFGVTVIPLVGYVCPTFQFYCKYISHDCYTLDESISSCDKTIRFGLSLVYLPKRHQSYVATFWSIATVQSPSCASATTVPVYVG